MRYLSARWLSFVGLLTVTLLLAACAGNAAPGEANAPRPAAGGANGGGTTVNVVAQDMAFALDTTRTAAGPLTFVFTNNGSPRHDFAIRGNGVDRKTPMIGRGETATLTVDLRPGTYTYECTVPGHDRAGMRGTFTVA